MQPIRLTAKEPLLKLLNEDLFKTLSASARTSSRQRQHHNLHGSPQEGAQRFLNAMEPDTYVVPHRHVLAGKEETLLVLQGSLGLLLFDADGSVVQTAILSLSGHTRGCHIAVGIWHSVLALESGTVAFEVKNGPYLPPDGLEQASWAPTEKSPEVPAWLARMRLHFESC